MRPHAEHLFKFVTSFKAFPANCRCRFLLCEVFFFGTARRTESQISERNEGRRIVTGTEMRGLMIEAHLLAHRGTIVGEVFVGCLKNGSEDA